MWQDIFLTTPSRAEQETTFDDEFIAPVMSVEMSCVNGQTATPTSLRLAIPVEHATDWLALAFPSGNNVSVQREEITRWRALEVGDMIRVGTAANGGFTGYLTVMETTDAFALWNRDDTKTFQIKAQPPGQAQDTTLSQPPTVNNVGIRARGGVVDNPFVGNLSAITSSFLNWAQEAEGVSNSGAGTGDFWGVPIGSLRCVRVNYAIDATTLPSTAMVASFTPFMPTASSGGVAHTASSATRGLAWSSWNNLKDPTRMGMGSGSAELKNDYEGANLREVLFYPCYKQRSWLAQGESHSSVLKLTLPSFIKQCDGVQLVGYSLIHKRNVGIHHEHEMYEDDWYALRIKEVGSNSGTLSNNKHANNCLHVIHANSDPAVGSQELHDYDDKGLATIRFSPSNLPSLSVQVTDRTGKEAHFGRMHLWLRIHTTC